MCRACRKGKARRNDRETREDCKSEIEKKRHRCVLNLFLFLFSASHFLKQPLAEDDASLLRARVAALEAELQGMRLSSMMMTSAAAAAAAAQPPLSPSPPVAGAAPSTSSASSSAAPHDDDDQPTALVPRAALELLKLKDQAMDSVLEGITIADARRPDMPLIYVSFEKKFFSSSFVFVFSNLFRPRDDQKKKEKKLIRKKKTFFHRSTAPSPASRATPSQRPWARTAASFRGREPTPTSSPGSRQPSVPGGRASSSF